MISNVKIGRDVGRERPFQRGDDFIETWARGGRVRIDQVQFRVARIADVMIDIHVGRALPLVKKTAPSRFASRAIDRDDQSVGLGRAGQGRRQALLPGRNSKRGDNPSALTT